MTRLPQLTTRVTITPLIKGGAYGQQLNEKATFKAARSVSQLLRTDTAPFAPTSQRLVLHRAELCIAAVSSRITNPSENGKRMVTQKCVGCVKLEVIRKNIWANFSPEMACNLDWLVV